MEPPNDGFDVKGLAAQLTSVQRGTSSHSRAEFWTFLSPNRNYDEIVAFSRASVRGATWLRPVVGNHQGGHPLMVYLPARTGPGRGGQRKRNAYSPYRNGGVLQKNGSA
jgi:hypothetical protein